MEAYRFTEEEFACLEQLRVPLAVYQFLDKRVVTRVLSAGFCELFDFNTREEAYEVMTRDMYSTAHPDDASRIADAAYRFATEGGRYEVVYRVRTRKSSVYRIVHAIGEHVFTEGGDRLAYVWYTDEGAYTSEEDAREKRMQETFRKALRHESLLRENYYDYLTGLPNMSHFFALVEESRRNAPERGGIPAILVLNLNGMRFFNRKYGFAEGDRLLKQISGILTRHFPSENCSRFGQDHFAVFAESEGLDETLRSVIRECEAANGGNSLTVRIGIYLDRQGDVEVSTACDRAKYACDLFRRARVSGFRYFDEAMLSDMERRQYIIDNLDRALAEGWITVCYQPIVRAANGRVCDEESLSRWVDPERGVLTPEEVIPVLEDARLIDRLDLYVLELTLAKLKRQAALGFYMVPQSVNLSRVDFDLRDMVEEICSRVDAAGIPHDLLTIEITESVVGRDFAFMKEQVERFQKLGFQVWMDDFGSGYSSLDVLQNIRFDLIKFDMRFMQRFHDREESRIILTELARMAIGLGIDTVCEGVETKEQVEFLREIGCTKLQGFYFCKPIPLEEIVERNRKGIQIGFENPDETPYYATLGRVNLYDMAVFAQDDQTSFGQYFNTLPMAVIESTDEDFMIVRCNKTYRDFMTRAFGIILTGVRVRYDDGLDPRGNGFLSAIRRCAADGGSLAIDEELSDGCAVHAFIKRIAVNPVTGTSALAVVVLSIADKNAQIIGPSYAHVARALSADYFDLFYVDPDTERFLHYSSAAHEYGMTMERHGEHFFAASRSDAMQRLYEADRDAFVRSFTKENVIRSLDTQGSFTLTYRLLKGGSPVYVNMKAVRMGEGDRHIIIGVNNVDVQMQEKEAVERMRSEQITYARIAALAGDFFCIYTVNPQTSRYEEYSATRTFEGFGIAKRGEDFFADSRKNSAQAVWPADQKRFLAEFTRDNILQKIESDGIFAMTYRLSIDGAPVWINLRAARVEEKDGPQLIIGLVNVDAQVRQENSRQLPAQEEA